MGTGGFCAIHGTNIQGNSTLTMKDPVAINLPIHQPNASSSSTHPFLRERRTKRRAFDENLD